MSFFDSILHLNLLIMDKIEELIASGLQIDLIHIHDWLVLLADEYLKKQYAYPIIATCHGLDTKRSRIDPIYEDESVSLVKSWTTLSYVVNP
ncbi:glycogen/starch synthase [Hazenella sp. IB182353]|uniref:glycogen/starch synthase n=1 Tax=Polycladospora coralii TaxID=2771432 RepID=UPI0017472130|nr:glycogen/starch synthase [Polycladospora coralii]MBS7532042.1 glycogen/starch synthase [Polycladospora coralii]